jgi:phosphinothricin acetyltransferase
MPTTSRRTDAITRAAELADLPALTAIYNHYVLNTAVTFDLEPFTPEGRRPWFDEHPSTGPHRLIVAASDDGRVIGYASSGRWRPKPAYLTTVEVSVYCHPEEIGRGYGRVLYAALFDAIALADVRRAVAGICLPNPASIKLHERCGFTLVGVFSEVGRKFGAYHDVAWYERRLDRPAPDDRATKD